MHTAKMPEPKIPKAGKGAGLCEAPAEGDSAVYDQGRLRSEAKRRICASPKGAGHGGSHPHLANEFVSALVQNREPFPNARESANWTCVGLCSHQSALKGGAIVKLPQFTIK